MLADSLPAILAAVSVLSPLAVAAGYAYGLLAHHVGRSTLPATALMAAGFGLSLGIGATATIGQLQQAPSAGGALLAMLSLAIAIAPVVVLGFAGRRRAAALYAAGAAAPWTLVFGIHLADLVAGADHAPLVTTAAFLAGAIPLIVAALVAARPDPVPLPDPLAPAGRPGSHQTGALSRALLARTRYGEVGPSLVLGLVGGLAVSTFVPTVPLASLLAVAAGAILGTELEVRWIPASIRPAAEAFHWIGRGAVADFRAASGSPVPTRGAAMEQWLATAPDTDAARRFRVELLAHLGRLDEARSAAARLPVETPLDRFRSAAAAADIDWKAGRGAPIDELSALAEAVGPPGDPARREAEGMVAWVASQARVADMDPAWAEPLARFRDSLGADATGLHATSMRRPVLTTALVASLAVVLLNLVLTGGLARLVP
ncbi:MAG: hypothetical protein AB1627_03890 [Chloroflexota bacterium]